MPLGATGDVLAFPIRAATRSAPAIPDGPTPDYHLLLLGTPRGWRVQGAGPDADALRHAARYLFPTLPSRVLTIPGRRRASP